MPGCRVLGEVHPVGAQNKTLISDTEHLCMYFYQDDFVSIRAI